MASRKTVWLGAACTGRFSYDNTGARRAFDLAACEICGAFAGTRFWWKCAGVEFMGIFFGRLQALRERGMP